MECARELCAEGRGFGRGEFEPFPFVVACRDFGGSWSWETTMFECDPLGPSLGISGRGSWRCDELEAR